MKSKNDSIFATHISYLYIHRYQFKYLRLEMLPIIAMWGKRHYKNVKFNGDYDPDPEVQGEVSRFRNNLNPISPYFDKELRQLRFYDKGVGVKKKTCYVTDTLLQLIGFVNGVHDKLEFIDELENFLISEAKRIKLNPQAPIYRRKAMSDEEKRYTQEKRYVEVGRYKKLTIGNIYSVGSLSLLLCYGAACLKYFYSSGAFCRKLFEKEFASVQKPYAYPQLMRYFLNGSNAENWLEERGSDSEIQRIASYMKDYVDVCMEFAHLHFTNVRAFNLAAMILTGIKFEMQQDKEEDIKVVPIQPVQLIIMNPLPS